jgi:hypothetical protein
MDPEDQDADSDPSIFIIDLQDANKKQILKKIFCILLFEGTFTSFSKVKCQKEVTKQSKSRFFLLFCLVIEGSGAGSGSRRPKNTWIRWIGIRWIRIRIRNTAKKCPESQDFIA